MSCMLRASGENFDVDRFLADCKIEPNRIWRKGEPKFPHGILSEKIAERSAVNFVVSSADFSELAVQFQDALHFLEENENEIHHLKNYPGVEYISVDFGAEIHPPGWCSFSFPPELLLLIGRLGIELDLSVYPVCDEDESET